jgi:hypothetical protein
MKSGADISDIYVVQAGSRLPDIRDYDAEFGGTEERERLEKTLLRKVDARMSILVVIYVLNYVSVSIKLVWCNSEPRYCDWQLGALRIEANSPVPSQIDRNNTAAARLRGFEEDLKLHGTQFATLLSIFYIGYVSMQVPSNIFLNYVGRPSLYLPVCMVVWGVIRWVVFVHPDVRQDLSVLSSVTGITHNFTSALLVRFFLGFVEATFFPGALFLVSKWCVY